MEILLKSYYKRIDELPTRADLKRLLKKCLYRVMTGQKLELEITFLYDVRKIINSVRGRCEHSYMDLIRILDETYQLAVDWNIASNFEKDTQLPSVDSIGSLELINYDDDSMDQESLQSFETNSEIIEESDENNNN